MTIWSFFFVSFPLLELHSIVWIYFRYSETLLVRQGHIDLVGETIKLISFPEIVLFEGFFGLICWSLLNNFLEIVEGKFSWTEICRIFTIVMLWLLSVGHWRNVDVEYVHKLLLTESHNANRWTGTQQPLNQNLKTSCNSHQKSINRWSGSEFHYAYNHLQKIPSSTPTKILSLKPSNSCLSQVPLNELDLSRLNFVKK